MVSFPAQRRSRPFREGPGAHDPDQARQHARCRFPAIVELAQDPLQTERSCCRDRRRILRRRWDFPVVPIPVCSR